MTDSIADSRLKPLRIALLDDHPIVLHGVADRLRREPDLVITGGYETSADLLRALAEDPPQLLVLDYGLSQSDTDGALLMDVLRRRYPAVKILIYSAHDDIGTIAATLRIGACGFVGKSSPLDLLIEAIRCVANHRVFLEAGVALRLFESSTSASHAVPDSEDTSEPAGAETHALLQGARLSLREREVIRCFLNGMTVTEIAAKFNRSIKTISTQKAAAYRKLGVTSDNGLFKIAKMLGDL